MSEPPNTGPAQGLYPTQTRLKLLNQVQGGQVYETIRYELGSWLKTGEKVTARMQELAAAGWAHLVPKTENVSHWIPTTRGYSILAAWAAVGQATDQKAAQARLVRVALGQPEPVTPVVTVDPGTPNGIAVQPPEGRLL